MENLSSFFLQLVDVPFENKNVEKFNLLALLKYKKWSILILRWSM